MIIDCHCHAGKGDGLTHPANTNARLGSYLQRATQAGINRSVLFSVIHSDYSVANRQVARIVRSNPHRFLGFAFVHPDRDRSRIHPMIKEAVEQHGFCGIKVHRIDGRITREICEVAKLFYLPILYDVMGEVSVLELLASEYPEIPFIIPHCGSFADDWKAQMAFIDHLSRHPNVYTDTSGVRRFEILEMAVKRGGASKILFGSDGPWLHPGVELAKVFALGLSRTERELVLGGNLLRLISKRGAGRRRAVQLIRARQAEERSLLSGAEEQVATFSADRTAEARLVKRSPELPIQG
jgi:uncharacterized protein